MELRNPAVAGHFYPDSSKDCREEIEALLSSSPRGQTAAGLPAPWPEDTQPVGGIVPHAGWVCSGAVAGQVLRFLLAGPDAGRPETIVLFGAAHRPVSAMAALFGRGTWETPLGPMDIDQDLASAILGACDEVEDDPDAHRSEHSIEVQLPIIRYLAPEARILPILVPHLAPAPAVGRVVAEQAGLVGRRVAFVGSTDLTHYGPRYGFLPKGSGPQGLSWAKDVNDRRMLDLICRMDADQVGPEARQHQNACGSGAVAATIAACRRTGAIRGLVLRHTTSAEVLGGRFGPMSDAVGYAGVVFLRPIDPAKQ
jgi:AmmeMemoRadiSam system protein B